jgi:hypothetical protein
MEGSRADLHVQGLHNHATLTAPVILQGGNQALKCVRVIRGSQNRSALLVMLSDKGRSIACPQSRGEIIPIIRVANILRQGTNIVKMGQISCEIRFIIP